MRIPQTTIEQLNAQADLVAIIRRHTILKPAGREFKGCCPFHGEKTPSFYVNPQTNLYYCFGCGVKGNAIRFLVDFERMTFIEAVKELALKTGIDLPKDDDSTVKYTRKPKTIQTPHNQNPNPQPLQTPQPNPPALSTQTPNAQTPLSPTVTEPTTSANTPNVALPTQIFGQEQQRPIDKADDFHPILDTSFDDFSSNFPVHEPIFESGFESNFIPPSEPQFEQFDHQLGNDGNLYQLLQAVSQFYQTMLKHFPHAYQYFKSRGLTDDTIATFELGYAPDAWQHLEKAFPNDLEGLKILGLVRTSQKGRDFNLFRDRVIFPIKDRQGRIVGFAGRAMSDDVMPKYINSSDSVVFAKQHILYGLYESRQMRAKDWLVVEGYMDVIALYQAGIYGAVAPMGTAVNEKQLDYLLKLNDTLTLSFDGDTAGQRASLRTLEVAMPVLPDGKSLKFLVLPNNHDPDTFIKEHGANAMQSAIANALPLSAFLYQIFSQKYDITSAENKAKIMAEVKELTAKLPKGSSFRWWLNSDIYNRLKDKFIKPATPTHAPTKSISPSVQLLLCLLYSPELLSNAPLERLYQQAGLYHAEPNGTPPLPTWQTLGIDGLPELVATITELLPFLTLATPSTQAIDANAHMILSALSNKTLQETLGADWREFVHAHQNHATIELLFDELLCQAVIVALKNEQKSAKSLLLTKTYKQRLIALEHYDRQHIKPAIAKNQESTLTP